MSAEEFTVGHGHAARAGLPLTGKGANKTPPDRAAEVFPGPVVVLPFAAVGRGMGAKSLMVCSAGGLTGKGKGPDCDDHLCG